MSTTSLGMHKLEYLWVSSRILERNLYELAQSNVVEKHNEQSRKPSSHQWILKKPERRIYHRCVVSDWPSNLLKCFLLIILPYMNDMISISIHKGLQSCLHLSSSLAFVALKVLIQNERTRWFMVQTLRSAFVRGIVRVGYSPPLFCYALLPRPTMDFSNSRCWFSALFVIS